MGLLPALGLIAVVTALAYSNVYQCPFVFDDTEIIVENPEIRHLDSFFCLAKLLKPRGIVLLSFALNYRMGGLNVVGYHLANVLIHLVNGIVAYCLAMRIFSACCCRTMDDDCRRSLANVVPLMSLFAALIFVAHPVQTQAVTYTVQRYTSMAALFYMASVLFYLKARQGAPRPSCRTGSVAFRHMRPRLRWTLYVLSVVCGMLAVMSKENAASLPLAIILAECVAVDRSWAELKKRIPLFVVMLMVWSVFVLYAIGFLRGGLEGTEFEVSTLVRKSATVGRWSFICTQLNVLAIYMRLLLLPIGQSADHLYPVTAGFFYGYTPVSFVVLVGVVLAGVLQWPKRVIIVFGLAWVFITLLVELTVLPVEHALFEHRLYLPVFGYAIAVVYLLFASMPRRRSWTVAVLVLLVLGLGTATYVRNRVWRSHIVFWSNVVSKNPVNHRGHNGLGLALANAGREWEAIASYREALRLRPAFARAHNNLGLSLRRVGRTRDAILHYNESIRIEPAFANAYSNLGMVMKDLGRVDEAVRCYTDALWVKPDFTEAHNNLANALASQGRARPAIKHYREALRLDPGFVEAHYNMGVVLEKQGRLGDAVNQYREAARLDPGFTVAYDALERAIRSMRAGGGADDD